jgi:hypothetical protein
MVGLKACTSAMSLVLREEGAPGRPEERLGVRYNLGLMRRLKFSQVLAPYDASLICDLPHASSTGLVPL